MTELQKYLQRILMRHGFTEAAEAVKDMSPYPKHLKQKIALWEAWEKDGCWPWPQWDRTSEKDWYAIRHQCEF